MGFMAETMGSRISLRRKELGIGQSALADEVGVNRSQVSLWENNRAVPRGTNLLGLARALKQTPDWVLYGGEGVSDARSSSVVREQAAPYIGGGGDSPGPAEELLTFLSERLGHRRIAGELTDKDLIAAAYTLARKFGFSAEDYRRLDAWRDQIIQSEKG